MKPKNTICLWFDKDAHEAARFYAATFPNSEVTAVRKAPSDYPGDQRRPWANGSRLSCGPGRPQSRQIGSDYSLRWCDLAIADDRIVRVGRIQETGVTG